MIRQITQQKLKIKVRNNNLEQFYSYKYIGSLVIQDIKSTKEIKASIV